MSFRIDEGGLRLGCCSHLSMSESQFNGMSEKMRRNLFERVYFVETPRYSYCLGAMGNLWTLVRYDRGFIEGTNVIVDKWR
jgi:hypothetical protein